MLEATMEMIKHYETMTYNPTAEQIRYYYVIGNFKLEFDALTD